MQIIFLRIGKNLRFVKQKPMKILQYELSRFCSKDLPPHLEYAFLEGDNKLPVIIAKDLSVLEKAALIKVLQSHNAWPSLGKLSTYQGYDRIFVSQKSNGTLPEMYDGIFHDLIEKNDVGNESIELDDVNRKAPSPTTTVKGSVVFLGRRVSIGRFIQNFSKIARPMTHLLEKETPFYFSKECIEAFNTLKKNLTEAPILIAPDWNEPFKLMCDASDFARGAVLGTSMRNSSGLYIMQVKQGMRRGNHVTLPTEKENVSRGVRIRKISIFRWS
ncbi:reverse transcriptase domain-containing protein [Tanacetum coccineum]